MRGPSYYEHAARALSRARANKKKAGACTPASAETSPRRAQRLMVTRDVRDVPSAVIV
jgi:hypothetical protein